MKRLIKKSLIIIISLISKFFSTRISKYWKRMVKFFYTNYIFSNFSEFGENTTVEYPINLRGGKYIKIGSKVSIGKNAIINAWDKHYGKSYRPIITIGDNTSIGEWCHLTSINKIQIGNNVLFGRFVIVTDNSHGNLTKEHLDSSPILRALVSKGPVLIEDNVWIGDKVTILANVKIGHNSVIGANSVVTKDVPPYSVVVGIPAKVIKELKYIN